MLVLVSPQITAIQKLNAFRYTGDRFDVFLITQLITIIIINYDIKIEDSHYNLLGQ